jgi:hypothetical protein
MSRSRGGRDGAADGPCRGRGARELGVASLAAAPDALGIDPEGAIGGTSAAALAGADAMPVGSDRTAEIPGGVALVARGVTLECEASAITAVATSAAVTTPKIAMARFGRGRRASGSIRAPGGVLPSTGGADLEEAVSRSSAGGSSRRPVSSSTSVVDVAAAATRASLISVADENR